MPATAGVAEALIEVVGEAAEAVHVMWDCWPKDPMLCTTVLPLLRSRMHMRSAFFWEQFRSVIFHMIYVLVGGF